ncbi:MAG: sugar phosphate isomerase/epimerase [Clostridia bacterium]
MEKIKLGIQLFSLRKYLKKPEDVRGVFEKCKALGAEVVQVSGMCPMDSRELNKISKETELPICITHSSFDRIVGDIDKLAEEHLTFNCKNIGIGMMPKKFRTGEAKDIFEFIEILNTAAEKLKAYDMKIAYHNHWFEFAKIDERIIMDMLIENTLPEVQFIPDTFWIKVGGFEPTQYLEKMVGRVDTLHLKDYKKGLLFSAFKPVGYGSLDFKSILACAENIGVKNAVVELDFALNPYKAMDKSLKYLKTIY